MKGSLVKMVLVFKKSRYVRIKYELETVRCPMSNQIYFNQSSWTESLINQYQDIETILTPCLYKFCYLGLTLRTNK